jgi:hypothetical protein
MMFIARGDTPTPTLPRKRERERTVRSVSVRGAPQRNEAHV